MLQKKKKKKKSVDGISLINLFIYGSEIKKFIGFP